MKRTPEPPPTASVAAPAEVPELLTQAYWDGVFAEPDPWGYASSDYERWKFEQTLALLPPGPIATAMELACAEGYLTQRIAERVGSLTAVDISEKALARARERCRSLRGVRFLLANIATDPLPDRFDLIVCSEMLFYLPREVLDAVAPKLAACLNPGGHLLLAHGNLVTDERTRTGFDWGHPFGAKTIGEVFAAVEGLHLLRELRTPLFTVQLFRRGAAPAAVARDEVPLPFDLELTPTLERTIIWDGAVRLRSEVAADAPTSEVPILMYHSVSDHGPPELAPYRVTPRAFREQMRHLRRHGYHSITLHDWADALRESRTLPGRPIIITFDDGYQDFLDNAFPILDRADFSATMFIVTDKVGGVADWDTVTSAPLKLMGWADIQALHAKGISFGSHSTRHSDLETLSEAALLADGQRSRRMLEEKLGEAVTIVSFPWGRSNAAVRRTLADCGYLVAVATDPGASRLGDDPMNLPRIEVFGSDSLAEFAAKLQRGQRPDAPPTMADDDCVGFGPPATPPVAVVPRTLPAASPGSDMTVHPTYVRSLSHRLDALVGEFVLLQNRLLQGLREPGSLQSRLVGLFCQPLTGSTMRAVVPGADLAPGIVLRFDEGASLSVSVQPKANHALSPDTHLNSVGLHLAGPTEWLAIEIDLDWPDLAMATRFQLSLYAKPNRHVQCEALLRLPLRSGGVQETTFASVTLDVHEPNAIASGDLGTPDFIALDTNRRAQVLLSFDCTADLDLTFHYLNLYFA